jgi:indolepyruvate ferredoxin oxidoreductase beta subunit
MEGRELRKYSVLIVGVGGQGIMTTGNLLKKIGQRKGWSVVGTETRGASQREGSVDSSVRYVILDPDEKRNERTNVISPLMPLAGADMLIAMETNEALRNVKFACEKTCVLVNLYEILPPQAVSENSKGAPFDEVIRLMKTFSPDVRAIKASDIANSEFGDLAMSNIIMLGAALATGKMPIGVDDVKEMLEEEGREKASGLLKGLEIGMNEIAKQGGESDTR